MSIISEKDPLANEIHQKTDGANQVNDLEEKFCTNEDKTKSGKNQENKLQENYLS